MSNKSKLTLIIDGNWLLMSRLSVLVNKYKDDEELFKNLNLILVKSINKVLKQFNKIDNIIFCTDGGSWRNKIDSPAFLLEEGIKYKGTRVKDENFNWEGLFKSFEEFCTILISKGITVCHVQDIEGDDWCYHWSTYLNSCGTNCIIWSKDKDLTQLVNIDKNKCFTVIWNADNGVITTDIKDEDLDFLFNNEFNTNEIIYNEIVQKSKDITKIDKNNIIIDKIIKGDLSDNIIPVALRNSKGNSDKKFKISSKDINYNLNINNDIEIKNYFINLLESKQYKDRVIQSLEEIIEHFNYNKTLIVLDKYNYPQYVLDIFEEYKTFNISKDINSVEQEINMKYNNLYGVLDWI